MLAKGWIKPTVSPYGSPVLFVQKNTAELWMCMDSHALNANTKLNVFPLPHISDLLDRLGKAKYFSSIDTSYSLQLHQNS